MITMALAATASISVNAAGLASKTVVFRGVVNKSAPLKTDISVNEKQEISYSTENSNQVFKVAANAAETEQFGLKLDDGIYTGIQVLSNEF